MHSGMTGGIAPQSTLHSYEASGKRSAFSLVELSIVLVILGLLVGGVLSGKSLIRAAEMRAVSSEVSRYVTAVQTFRDKYMAIPGDMANAHLFWGARDGGNGYGGDCRLETNATGTCSGNGNGRIVSYDGVDPDASSYTFESYLAWDHLARAGLIEGTYTGNGANIAGNTICVDASNGSVPGCNVPRSKLAANTMWNFVFYGNLTSHPYLFNGDYGHSLQLTRGPGWINPINGLLSPEEVWNIDTKVDDGRPATGRLVASRRDGQCLVGNPGLTATNPGTNQYQLSLPSWAVGTTCVPVVRNLF
jgi:prepilin-type N-terminal cleavage/methylation domain-containing protein